MRFFLALVALFVSISAFALPVYNCDVTVTGKRGAYPQNDGWTKKLLLSPAFTNKVDFHQTVLELRVDAGGVLAGSVNGQPNFMLSGDVHAGKFESAYHTGTVKCDPEIDLSFVLQFIPWKQYYTVDPIVSRGHIHTQVEMSQVDYGLVCFLGDVKSTLEAFTHNFGVSGKIVNDYRIDLTWEANDCVRWEGTNPDNSQCLEYRRNKRTKSVRNCYGEPDPRS